MPSLWRLQHAGALGGHAGLRRLGRDRRRAPRLGARRGRERDPGVITSRANSHVKAARALGEAKERKRTGLFVDEGEDALRAALAAGIAPVEAFVDDDLGSDRIADELAAAGHARPALHDGGDGAPSRRCRTRAAPSACCARTTCRRWSAGTPASAVGLLLYGVSDPGNLGTLLRSAQGFGPAHVALAEGCADPLSPRAVRASMGALYAVPVITLGEAPPLPVIALDARGERTLAELAPRAPVAFALGGERTGLPPEVTAGASAVARIPLADGAESLNVAIAGALALYELRRAPRTRPSHDVDLVALAAVERLAAEARLGRDHGQARLGAERAPFRAAAPLERHRDDAARAGGRRVRGGARSRPRAVARRCPRAARSSGRAWRGCRPRSARRRRTRSGRPSPSSAAAALSACTRSASPERCMNVRKGAITRSLCGSGGGLRRSPTTVSTSSPTPSRCARRCGLGEHRGRGIERDHAMAVARELDRDAPAAGAQLHDRAGRALAGQHVERDVVVDAGAPAVIERPQPLVRLTARCCCSASHTR